MTSPSKTSAEIAAEEYGAAEWEVYREYCNRGNGPMHFRSISRLGFEAGAQWALTHSPEVQGLRAALNRLNISSLHNISRYDSDGDVECTPHCAACNVIKALAAFDAATRGLK